MGWICRPAAFAAKSFTITFCLKILTCIYAGKMFSGCTLGWLRGWVARNGEVETRDLGDLRRPGRRRFLKDTAVFFQAESIFSLVMKNGKWGCPCSCSFFLSCSSKQQIVTVLNLFRVESHFRILLWNKMVTSTPGMSSKWFTKVVSVSWVQFRNSLIICAQNVINMAFPFVLQVYVFLSCN